MKKQILRKEIARNVIGNLETINNYYFEKNVLTTKELQELQDYWEDPEEAFDAGLVGGFDCEIFCIEVDKLLKNLDIYFKEYLESDNTHAIQWELFVKIKEKLQVWKGFDLWV